METAVVLVVEDEPTVREVLREMLAEGGYHVVLAADGVEALTCLAENRVDIVISDIQMPGMGGYALYDRVRSRPDWITLPFVFLTGAGEPERRRHAKEVGVDDYLVKPVTSEDLLLAVRTLLRRRRQIEAGRSEQMAQLKNTILTTIAHELRTPLTTVLGYAELLRDAARPAEAEGLHSLVEGLQAGAERLRRLADDLMTLVDLRSGDAYAAYVSRRAPLGDIAALLHEAAWSRRGAAQARGVSLEVEVLEGTPALEGDAALLTGAVVRLVDNAIKFSKAEGGRVILRARPVDGGLDLEVEDEGIGIPPEAQEHLWQMFYQVDRTRNEQQGTGCGLAIAHAVVLMHGGRLSLTSRVGVGSTFRMHFPAGPSGAP